MVGGKAKGGSQYTVPTRIMRCPASLRSSVSPHLCSPRRRSQSVLNRNRMVAANPLALLVWFACCLLPARAQMRESRDELIGSGSGSGLGDLEQATTPGQRALIVYCQGWHILAQFDVLLYPDVHGCSLMSPACMFVRACCRLLKPRLC